VRRPPTVPEEILQVAPLTIRFPLSGETEPLLVEYDALEYTEVASNVPASMWVWHGALLAVLANSQNGSLQAVAYASPSSMAPEPHEQFIAKAVVGVEFEAWQSGKLEIVAQFGERHISTVCGTDYYSLQNGAVTVSGYTAVSHYMPPDQDESVYYGHKTDFSHVDTGDIAPGLIVGSLAEVEDEWESAFGGLGAGPLPFVLAPEVVMIQQGELCSVYAGFVTDAYAANHWTYAGGVASGWLDYIDVTIKPVG